MDTTTLTALTDRELALLYRHGPEDEIYVLNEIAVRAGIDLNETEQGFSKKAFEQAEAFVEHQLGGAPYDQSDPKHPSWRERMSDLWDLRPGK